MNGEHLESQGLVVVGSLASENRFEAVNVVSNVDRRIEVVETFRDELVDLGAQLLFVTALQVVLHVTLFDFETILAGDFLEDLLQLLVLLVNGKRMESGLLDLNSRLLLD